MYRNPVTGQWTDEPPPPSQRMGAPQQPSKPVGKNPFTGEWEPLEAKNALALAKQTVEQKKLDRFGLEIDEEDPSVSRFPDGTAARMVEVTVPPYDLALAISVERSQHWLWRRFLLKPRLTAPVWVSLVNLFVCGVLLFCGRGPEGRAEAQMLQVSGETRTATVMVGVLVSPVETSRAEEDDFAIETGITSRSLSSIRFFGWGDPKVVVILLLWDLVLLWYLSHSDPGFLDGGDVGGGEYSGVRCEEIGTSGMMDGEEEDHGAGEPHERDDSSGSVGKAKGLVVASDVGAAVAGGALEVVGAPVVGAAAGGLVSGAAPGIKTNAPASAWNSDKASSISARRSATERNQGQAPQAAPVQKGASASGNNAASNEDPNYSPKPNDKDLFDSISKPELEKYMLNVQAHVGSSYHNKSQLLTEMTAQLMYSAQLNKQEQPTNRKQRRAKEKGDSRKKSGGEAARAGTKQGKNSSRTTAPTGQYSTGVRHKNGHDSSEAAHQDDVLSASSWTEILDDVDTNFSRSRPPSHKDPAEIAGGSSAGGSSAGGLVDVELVELPPEDLPVFPEDLPENLPFGTNSPPLTPSIDPLSSVDPRGIDRGKRIDRPALALQRRASTTTSLLDGGGGPRGAPGAKDTTTAVPVVHDSSVDTRFSTDAPLRNNYVPHARLPNGQQVPLRWCTYCALFQPVRCKHCRKCKRCVRGHDHHCPWTGNCVGELNKRWFVLYVAVQWWLVVQVGVLVRSFLSRVRSGKNLCENKGSVVER